MREHDQNSSAKDCRRRLCQMLLLQSNIIINHNNNNDDWMREATSKRTIYYVPTVLRWWSMKQRGPRIRQWRCDKSRAILYRLSMHCHWLTWQVKYQAELLQTLKLMSKKILTLPDWKMFWQKHTKLTRCGQRRASFFSTTTKDLKENV